MLRCTSRVGAIALLSAALTLFPVGATRADDGLLDVREVREAMMTAAEAFHGLGYQGAYADGYSLDLQTRYRGRTRYDPWPDDEPDWVETEPPNGAWVGRALLRAYRATGDEYYLQMAEEIADALAVVQTETGGWRMRTRLSEPHGPDTPADLDDNRSQSSILFLIELVDAGGDERHRVPMQRGLQMLLDAQYPSGGWPQAYPPPEDEHDLRRYHTINDATIPDCMRTLLTAYHAFGNQEYLDAVTRAADWLLQVRLPGAVWAQQYYDDFVTGPLIPNHPAPARWFEPMAITAGESASVIRILTEVWLETGDDRYIEPFDEVIEWYERSRLEDGRWARFYELHTNRPLYCTPDRVITYSDENLRPGYAWKGTWGDGAIRTASRAQELGLDGMLAEREAVPDDEALQSRGERAREAIEAMDERGFWIRGERIRTRDFNNHMNAMSAYLEALEARDELPE